MKQKALTCLKVCVIVGCSSFRWIIFGWMCGWPTAKKNSVMMKTPQSIFQLQLTMIQINISSCRRHHTRMRCKIYTRRSWTYYLLMCSIATHGRWTAKCHWWTQLVRVLANILFPRSKVYFVFLRWDFNELSL